MERGTLESVMGMRRLQIYLRPTSTLFAREQQRCGQRLPVYRSNLLWLPRIAVVVVSGRFRAVITLWRFSGVQLIDVVMQNSAVCQVHIALSWMLSCHSSKMILQKARHRCSYRERKCAENYNKWHNKFIFLNAISILVISNHNSFRVPFDKIAFVYFIWKIYLYFSIGNGEPREPALCQLYRHTFVS